MRPGKDRKVFRTVFAAGAVFLLFWVFSVPCPVKLIFSVPCPTCGVSRALACLLRGDISGYFAHQPMALPLALAVVLCFLLPVMGKKGLRIGVFVFEGLVLAANTVLYVLRLINR